MGKMFISYRRDDAAPWAGRLYERLTREFDPKQIFMDVDNIPAGVDFAKHLDQQVGDCDVFVCVIGKNWADCKDDNGLRRLDDPDDFVRIEVESALNRGIQVIPLVVDGAVMPDAAALPPSLKPLSRRQAIVVSHAKFGAEVNALIRLARQAFAERTRSEALESGFGNWLLYNLGTWGSFAAGLVLSFVCLIAAVIAAVIAVLIPVAVMFGPGKFEDPTTVALLMVALTLLLAVVLYKVVNRYWHYIRRNSSLFYFVWPFVIVGCVSFSASAGALLFERMQGFGPDAPAVGAVLLGLPAFFISIGSGIYARYKILRNL